MTTRIRRFVSATIVSLMVTFGFPASAEENDGRYVITPLEGGIVKLDTRTGAVTECRRKDDMLHCTLVPDERQALQDEIDRISRENAELQAQLGSKAPPAGGSAEKAAPSLPSDADVDRALSLMERFLRRFRDIMREQDDGKSL